ncbi:MAG TPA: pitrilysin family protein [Bacillales bacterium]|nr:pitrilysin family protein [Bacillales bacterium]
MVTKHQCRNGVRILLDKIPSVRSVAIGIWVGTGSRNETRANNGVSHFLEHMFFKGTHTRNARDIAESFDRIGGHVNAFTSKEYTCFHANVLDNHGDYALEVLADMFFNSTFSSDELVKEKQVVFEEIKMYEDTPDEVVHDLLGEACFGEHPLGYPILGSEKSLNTFSSDTLRDYMNQSYTPDNVVISIAGNVDESIVRKAEAYFGSYQAAQEKSSVGQPDFQANRMAKKKDTEQAHLCLGFNGLPIRDEKIYGLSVLNSILGGSMSSRLFQEVREERGLAYSIFSYHSAFRDNGVVTIYGGTGASRVEELYDTICDILEAVKQEGVTETELENNKEQIKGHLVLGLEGTNSRMSLNGKNELFLGRHRSLDDMVEEINAVTIDEVNKLARTIFTNQFSCSLVSPSGSLPQSLQ